MRNRLTLIVALIAVFVVVWFLARGLGEETPAANPSATNPGLAEASAGNSCSGAGKRTQSAPAWDGTLALLKVGRKDDATKAAVATLKKTGQLPEQVDDCTKVLKLLSPSETRWYKTLLTQLKDWVKDWWWLAAPLLLLLVGGLGWLVRRRWWRRRRWVPTVRLATADAEDKATGLDIGSRLSATLRAQLMRIDDKQLGTAKGWTTADDAITATPPMDDLSDHVKWFVALWQWLIQRNHLTVTMTLAPTRPRRVVLIVALRELNGDLTRTGLSDPAPALIERATKAIEPDTKDYLRLVPAVFAWTLFHVKEVTGEEADLPAQVGTSRWGAYSRFLEGGNALEEGDLPTAKAHFAAAKEADDSEDFFELRLNEAYTNARLDDMLLWVEALNMFRTLAPRPHP